MADSAQEISLERIEALISSIGALQMAIEPSNDVDLGFKMWGGKDSAGTPTKFLAKDKNARVNSMKILDMQSNAGFVRVDASGLLYTLGAITKDDIPSHNGLNGLQGGASGQYYHMTSSQVADLHAPTTVDGYPLSILNQCIKFNYNTGDFTIAGNQLNIGTGYTKVDGSRAFTSPVSSPNPTMGSHLVNKDYVDSLMQGIDWLENVISFYDPTTATPTTPTLGDRYIASATAHGWTVNNVYEWTGSVWHATVAQKGFAVVVENPVVIIYIYTGVLWNALQLTAVHNNMTGLQGGTTNEYYHLSYLWYYRVITELEPAYQHAISGTNIHGMFHRYDSPVNSGTDFVRQYVMDSPPYHLSLAYYGLPSDNGGLWYVDIDDAFSNSNSSYKYFGFTNTQDYRRFAGIFDNNGDMILFQNVYFAKSTGDWRYTGGANSVWRMGTNLRDANEWVLDYKPVHNGNVNEVMDMTNAWTFGISYVDGFVFNKNKTANYFTIRSHDVDNLFDISMVKNVPSFHGRASTNWSSNYNYIKATELFGGKFSLIATGDYYGVSPYVMLGYNIVMTNGWADMQKMYTGPSSGIIYDANGIHFFMDQSRSSGSTIDWGLYALELVYGIASNGLSNSSMNVAANIQFTHRNSTGANSYTTDSQYHMSSGYWSFGSVIHPEVRPYDFDTCFLFQSGGSSGRIYQYTKSGALYFQTNFYIDASGNLLTKIADKSIQVVMTRTSWAFNIAYNNSSDSAIVYKNGIHAHSSGVDFGGSRDSTYALNISYVGYNFYGNNSCSNASFPAVYIDVNWMSGVSLGAGTPRGLYGSSWMNATRYDMNTYIQFYSTNTVTTGLQMIQGRDDFKMLYNLYYSSAGSFNVQSTTAGQYGSQYVISNTGMKLMMWMNTAPTQNDMVANASKWVFGIGWTGMFYQGQLVNTTKVISISSNSATWDANDSDCGYLDLNSATGAVTLTILNVGATGTARLQLHVVQGGTPRTLTIITKVGGSASSTNTTKWSGGSGAISTTANAVDVVSLLSVYSGIVLGVVAKAFA